MRCEKANPTSDAFTLVEMLVVIAIIGILAGLLLPALAGGKKRATRIVCENQLQQIALGFQSFAHDHGSKFPFQVSTNDGGTLEYVQSGVFSGGIFDTGYRSFQALASVLQTPRILVCPADTRTPAADFDSLQNSNLSYFVATSARYNEPISILSGDGNLAAPATLLQGGMGGRLTWNRRLHEFKGNVLFADGHVEEWNDTGGPALGSSVTLILPSPSSGKDTANASAPFGATSLEHGGANSNPPTNRETGTVASAMKPPANPGAEAPPARAGINRPRVVIPKTASGPGPAVLSPAVSVEMTVTVTQTTTVTSSSTDEETLMSPGNRQLARILRDLLAGTYLMVLLLLLLYGAYRYCRWKQRQAERQA